MKVMSMLKAYDNGIVADNSIEFRESKIFRRKYPGRNKTKRTDDRYLNQLISGIFTHSKMEPL